jgi:PAS domain S-box-containing protein
VPRPTADFADLNVGAQELLAAVLDTTAQPIWVVDPDDRIRYANRAAVDALGYDGVEQLVGRRSHGTLHQRHPDGSPRAAAECPILLRRATGETVRIDEDWLVRRDGSMFPVSYVSAPIAMPEGRGAVVAFTDIGERLRAERSLREHEAALAQERAALRRLTGVVTRGAELADVFAAIAREVAQVLGLTMVQIWRWEADGTGTVAGTWCARPQPYPAGSNWAFDDPEIAALVQPIRAGRGVRIQTFAEMGGATVDAVRQFGFRSAAGAPIIVAGEVWGMIAGTSDHESLPDHIEDRLAEFTELVATAISSSASREQLSRLADEQAALRRVATLVARQAPPAVVFGAVAEEVGGLLRVEDTTIFRYEDDWTATVVADRGERDVPLPIGSRMSLAGESATARVRRTGRPARVDDFSNATGPLAEYTREAGIGSTVGSPIVVDGALWGAMIAATRSGEPMPRATESHMGAFTELVATAISNMQARSDLAASRARIVAATDAERRRVVRDLHDGAQQRLVHTLITMKMTRDALKKNPEKARPLLDEAVRQGEQAVAELRELAHGILPNVLTRGGLRAAVNALASRMPVPVENGVTVGRLPNPIEATAYFVVAEALTNVAKHAGAQHAAVIARIEDDTVRVEVRDDGVGGARPDGSGFVGLADRLAVLDGRLRVECPADGGTHISAYIPLCG